MLREKEFTGEEIQLLQADDDNSSHAEMIAKALRSFSTAAQETIASQVADVEEGYELFIFFRYETDLEEVISGRNTLDRFSRFKVDPYIDPAGYADFCNKVNKEATRGEIMASILNVIMDHVPGPRRFGVAVDSENLPKAFDIVFCFRDPILHSQIEKAQKMLSTEM